MGNGYGYQKAVYPRDAGRLLLCPLRSGIVSTLRTVSISARMVAIMLPLARRTAVQAATQCLSPTGDDGVHRLAVAG